MKNDGGKFKLSLSSESSGLDWDPGSAFPHLGFLRQIVLPSCASVVSSLKMGWLMDNLEYCLHVRSAQKMWDPAQVLMDS